MDINDYIDQMDDYDDYAEEFDLGEIEDGWIEEPDDMECMEDEEDS